MMHRQAEGDPFSRSFLNQRGKKSLRTPGDVESFSFALVIQ
jgi:hypothetical protein